MTARPELKERSVHTTKAFTLVEVVVALALSASLMLALLTLSTGMIRAQRALEREDVAADPLAQPIALFRLDLTHAQQFRSSSSFAELRGTGCIDRNSGQFNHKPSIVRYELRSAGGVTCLVRRQTEHTKLSNQRDWVEIVIAGVDSFNITPIGLPATPDKSPSDQPPHQVRIEIRWTDPTRPPYSNEVFVH